MKIMAQRNLSIRKYVHSLTTLKCWREKKNGPPILVAIMKGADSNKIVIKYPIHKLLNKFQFFSCRKSAIFIKTF